MIQQYNSGSDSSLPDGSETAEMKRISFDFIKILINKRTQVVNINVDYDVIQTITKEESDWLLGELEKFSDKYNSRSMEQRTYHSMQLDISKIVFSFKTKFDKLSVKALL